MKRRVWRAGINTRRRLYEILEHGPIGDRTGLIVSRLIVLLIVTNLVAMTLDSVPKLEAQYGPLFLAIEVISLIAFTVEYALRVWVAAEHAPYRHSSERKARWKFVTSPLGLIDLLAVRPFCGSCWYFEWCVFSSWRATRPQCARCWMCFTTSGVRCSAAS